MMANSVKGMVDTHRWLSRIPRSSHHEMLRMQKFRDRLTDEDDKAVFSETMMVNKVVSGITRLELAVAYMLVLLKIVVFLALTWYGSGYIVRSRDNEALIMNAVALCFVVEISTYSYRFVATNTMCFFLDSLPSVGLGSHEVNDDQSLLEDIWPMISIVVLAGLTVSIWHAWC
eukprot:UN0898